MVKRIPLATGVAYVIAAGAAALPAIPTAAAGGSVAHAARAFAVGAAQDTSPLSVCSDGVHYAVLLADGGLAVRDRTQPDSAPPLLTLRGVNGDVLAAAFTQNGDFIAVAGTGRLIQIFRTSDGKRVRQIHEPEVSKDHIPAGAVSQVRGIAFNPSGTDLLVTDYGYGVLGRYHGSDPSDLAFEDAFYTSAPLYSVVSDGANGWVGGDGGGAFHFYDSHLKEIGATTSKMASIVRTMAVSEDGAFLASGGDNKEILIWKFGSAELASQRDGLELVNRFPVTRAVEAVAFRGDKPTLLYLQGGNQPAEWAYAAAPETNAQPIATAAPAPPTLPKVTTTPPAAPVAQTPPPAPPPVIARPAAPEPAAPAVSTPPAGIPPSLAAKPSARTGTVSAASLPPRSHPHLEVWQTGKLVGHSDYVNAVAFSPDGKFVASASRDKTVRLWDVATATQNRIVTKHEGYASAVAFRPDGKILASGGWDDKIKLFDLPGGAEHTNDKRLDKQTSYILSLDFNPDGSHLASGSNDRTARVFNLESGASQGTSALPDGIAALSYSPDGSKIAGACLDGTVYVWDAGSMTTLRKFRANAPHPLLCVTFVNDMTLVAGGKGGALSVWSMGGGLVATLAAGDKDIYAVAYDEPRHLLAAGGADRLIRFWPTASLLHSGGRRVTAELTKAGQANTVRALAFSADGKRLASGGWDYNILLWSIGDSGGGADAAAQPTSPGP